MVSTLDIVDLIYKKLDVSALKTELTGKLYKNLRPASSKVEDCVINCLPVTADQLQSAVSNVNIHVPDLVINANGTTEFVPNHLRLKDLCSLAIDALSDQWGDEYNFDIQQQTLFRDEAANEHYVNIRIDFYYINIKN